MMANTFDIADVLHGVAISIANVLDASGAGVAVADGDDRLRFLTATGADVEQVEYVQDDDQAGPCVEAYRTGEPIAISDIRAIDDWAGYRAIADDLGFRSVLGVPLHTRERRFGAINVFDRRVRTWDDGDLDDAGVLADIATGYILRAGELHDAHEVNAQLRRAIETRDVIGQAKGILMGIHGIDADAAFDLLRSKSQSGNLRLRDVAAHVAANASTARTPSN